MLGWTHSTNFLGCIESRYRSFEFRFRFQPRQNRLQQIPYCCLIQSFSNSHFQCEIGRGECSIQTGKLPERRKFVKNFLIFFFSPPTNLSLTIHWTLKLFAIIWNSLSPHCCSIQWRKVHAPNNHRVCLLWTMQRRTPERWLKSLR